MELENLPQISEQLTESSEATSARKARRPRGSKKLKSSFADPRKLGMATVGMTNAEFLKPMWERRRLLNVPQEILQANPDKHFCFVNMNKLTKNGMWHQNGFTLYNVAEDPEKQNRTKFNNGIDNYIHRNEMVLAYITKEEYELRQLELKVMRGKVDLTEKITKEPNLAKFSPHAKRTIEQVRYAIEKEA